MTLEQILSILVAALPSITAIAGCVVTFLKNKTTCQSVVDKFEDVRQEIFNTKEYSDLKNQLTLAHQENRELKKKINELLTKIDKINRKNDEE